MNERNHERWHEEVAAYLLGALDPEEATALEHHAADCERCQAEIRWLTPAMDALPDSVPRVEPPRELRSRVMAEVRADARRASGARAAEEGGPWHRAKAWLHGLGAGPMGLRPVVGTAVAVLVVVAVAGFALAGGIGSGSEDADAGTIVAGHAPGVTAKIVMEGDGGALQLANVQPLPEERVLQAWVQRDGEVRPVPALFVPDHEGRAATTIANMNGVEVVMVTTEPPGGSKAPTSSPIVTIPVPQ